MQLFLKEVLVQSTFSAEYLEPEVAEQLRNMQLLLKYSLIVISSAPLMVIYPFIQKFC